jgi:lysophospholipase L1-like esterase
MIGLVPKYDAETYGGRIHINSLGFRGAEFDPVKPAGTFRMIALGDSSTFGLAGEACNYSAALERLLRTWGAPRRYEVVNAGVEGYDSEDALRLLEKRALGYQPDLVTVYIGWNDLVKRDPMDTKASGESKWLAYRMYDVYLIRFWRKVVFAILRPMVMTVGHEMPTEEEAAYAHYVPSVFVRNLERIVQLVRGRGVPLVFLTLPSPLKTDMHPEDIKKLYFPYYTYNLKRFALAYQRYNDIIRGVARANGVPVVDLAARLADRGDLFMDTSHPTCAGHTAIAGEIQRGLIELGAVPARATGGGA